MNFEKRHEKIRTELNSLSKKIIRLRAENRFLKKLYLLEKEKSKPEKKVRKKRESKRFKAANEFFDRNDFE